MTATLAVAELFGPTVQGEGPSCGRLATFLRLGGCNLHCSWCDTPYTWDASRFRLREQITAMAVGEVLAAVAARGAPLTVITGGEPLLHQRRHAWPTLLGGLSGDVEIETNGTVAPTSETVARVTRFNVSPKLAHAGDPAALRERLGALTALAATGRAVFKFVARDPRDVDEAAALAARAGIAAHQVWIMPEGVDAGAVLSTGRRVAQAAIDHRFNLTTRLHVLLWGDERGR